MKHRVKGKKFNRDTNNRKALLRNLVRQLVENGFITTTGSKAKETKRLADKLINKAQTDTVSNRRLLHTFFGKRDVVNTLVERVAPLFTDRSSGFTRITSVGRRRGDNTEIVKLELVKQPAVVGTLKNPQPKAKAVKKAPAKKAPAKKAPAKKAPAKKAPAKKAASTKTAKNKK